jgi:hypothetical protein
MNTEKMKKAKLHVLSLSVFIRVHLWRLPFTTYQKNPLKFLPATTDTNGKVSLEEGHPMQPPSPSPATPTCVIPANHVRQAEQVVRVAVPRPGPNGEPTVEVVREGEVIRAVDVTCGCGQTIRLLCRYDQA